jgi:hypothetical protein
MRSGTNSEREGVYRGFCCAEEVTVPVGVTLPVCPKCKGLTTWSMVKAIFSQSA